MFLPTISEESDVSDDLEKIANSLVYKVIRRILDCKKYQSASGICSPSSPSLLCSLSEDSVDTKSLPLVRTTPEDDDRYSLGISMDDVMSKLTDTESNEDDLASSINENEFSTDIVSNREETIRESGDIKKCETEFDKTDTMATADDKTDVSSNRNQIFTLRRSFSESTLSLVRNRDVLMREVTDEHIRENLHSLKADLDKLFNESEIIITKCMDYFCNFFKLTEEESLTDSEQSMESMTERLTSIKEFANIIRNGFKEYNNMIKRIIVSTYRIAKESAMADFESLQRQIHQKNIVLNHFREENMRITHTMMEKEQDWALLKAKLYTEILNLTKETAKPWKELFSAGPKFGLVSLPWKRLKSLFEIYHSQEKMMSLVLDRDRKINELKLLIYQQQIMNCSLQERLLLLNASDQEINSTNSHDTEFIWNEVLKPDLSRVSDLLHICTGSAVPYISADPDEAMMEIFNLKGEEDLSSQESYPDYIHNIDNCADACSAPAVHDLMARFQDTTCE